MEEHNEDPIAQARRYLTDIVVFGGPKFIIPVEDEVVKATTPIATETFQSVDEFVFGAGNPSAGIVFVGEVSSTEEGRQDEFFDGAAGQLLTKIIAAMGLGRGDVYICNILKSRLPENRDLQPEEIAQCELYIKRQIEIILPKVICTLGLFAAQTLLRSSESMSRLRGRAHQYEGIPLVATYHPAALLRNPQWKRPTWEDVKKVRMLYDGIAL